MGASQPRRYGVEAGIRIEALSCAWMLLEALVALVAAAFAGSFLLAAFGIDSLIEIVASAALLWRLCVEALGADAERVKQVERLTTRIVAMSLAGLCVYVLATSIYGLAAHLEPESSPAGIAIALAAAVLMPALAGRKRQIAASIGSDALHAEAVDSITCAYMAATVLVGLLLDTALGWWWAEDVAGLVFLVWLARETLEAWREAREDAIEADAAP